MRLVPHPLVQRDVEGIYEHVLMSTGDAAAADRRLGEIGRLLGEIMASPGSGRRLSGALDGWLVRHGGRGRRLTVVFRADPGRDALLVALVAFGGRDWLGAAPSRPAGLGPG